jgi:hypothetical protein
MPTTNPNGRVLYEGPSMLDGVPIVVIATGFAEDSGNGKTGGMLQTWILRQDIPPHHAFRTEDGYSVCGDCPHRLSQTCYVRWYQAPLAVWNCWHHGAGYAPAQPSDFDGVLLRVGSAGDPCAAPEHVWREPIARCSAHTGYTQQWRQAIAAWARGVLQASCHGFGDYLEATAHGWATFLVTPADTPDPAGTVHCAASAERGHKTTCAACTLCDGATANVVIHAHGSRASRVAMRN